MTSIRFRSLPSKAYSVSVSQAGAVAELSPATTPPVTSPGPEESRPAHLEKVGTVTIETNRPLDIDGHPVATAPGGVFFTAKAEGFVSSDPNFAEWKDLNYRWSFDDPGWYTRHDTEDLPWGRYYEVDGEVVLVNDGRVPEGASVRFLGNDKNVAYGPWVCHVFAPEAAAFDRQPEKLFRVRCEVRAAPTEKPLLVVERDMKLRNPDSVFARGRTILISEKGDTSNPRDPIWEPEKYPGASLTNNHRDAISAIYGFATAENHQPVRILFHRGESPVLADTKSQNWGGFTERLQKLFIGSYGNPADPPPQLRGENDFRFEGGVPEEREFAIWGLDYHGPYDPSQPEAVVRPPDGLLLRRGTWKTVWDMSVKGWNTCVSGEVDPDRLGFQNTVIGNTFIGFWSNYGIYVHGGPPYFGQCGVWVKQPYGTVTHAGRDEAGPSVYADHGPIRNTSAGSPGAFNLVDYRSLNSWSGLIQPCNRWNIKPLREDCPDPGDVPHYNWDRARFEGGIGIIQDTSSASFEVTPENPFLPTKGLFDKIYTVTYQAENTPAQIVISGPVVRNSIIVVPNQPSMSGGAKDRIIQGKRSVLDMESGKFDPRVLDFGVELYSNTLADLRSYSVKGHQFINPDEFSMWKHSTITNNLTHAPDLPDITTTDGPLDDAVLWTVEFDGLRYAGDPFQPIYAIPRDTARRFAPLPRSPAYHGAEAGKIAVDDFYGRIRTGTPSRGAVEAD